MKKFSFKDPIQRREFLRGGVRYGMLAGLAAAAARAVSNGGGRLADQTCTNKGICDGCVEYPACELPQALSARQAKAAPNSGGAYEEILRIPGSDTPSLHLEIGPDDRLYLATGNAIIVMSQEGVREREIALEAQARCVAVAKDGTLFAGLRDHVEVFDPKGARIAMWESPGPRTWLTGLAVGESDLFAADAGGRVVLRYDLAGKLVGRIGEKNEERDIPGFVIPSPYFSVRIHPDGLLRVNNPGRHRVEAYTFEGEFAGAWGKASGLIDGFCGCCNPTRIALLPDGRMVTCEKGMPRVKIYSITGEFESVVAPAAAFPKNVKVGPGERSIGASLVGVAAATDSRGRIAILDHITGEIRILQPTALGRV